MIKLFALRFSIGYGWQWVHERDCAIATANEWLAVFRKSEPDVRFVLTNRKPKVSKSAY